jgi:hypothetical protein
MQHRPQDLMPSLALPEKEETSTLVFRLACLPVLTACYYFDTARLDGPPVIGANCCDFLEKMARPARFERATTCLEGRCSIQLSYGRSLKFRYLRVIFSAPRKSYPEIVPRSTKEQLFRSVEHDEIGTTKRQTGTVDADQVSTAFPLCVIGRDFRTVQDCGQAGKKKSEDLELGTRQGQAGRTGAERKNHRS